MATTTATAAAMTVQTDNNKLSPTLQPLSASSSQSTSPSQGMPPGAAAAPGLPGAQQQQGLQLPQDPNRKKTTGPIHNPRYKSILCDHWERNNGTCPYAEKCQFAHGPQELAKWQAHRARQQQLQQQLQQQQQFASPVKPVTGGAGFVPPPPPHHHQHGHHGHVPHQGHLGLQQPQQPQQFVTMGGSAAVHPMQMNMLAPQQQQPLMQISPSSIPGAYALPQQQQQQAQLVFSQQQQQKILQFQQQQQMQYGNNNSNNAYTSIHLSPVKPTSAGQQQDLLYSSTLPQINTYAASSSTSTTYQLHSPTGASSTNNNNIFSSLSPNAQYASFSQQSSTSKRSPSPPGLLIPQNQQQQGRLFQSIATDQQLYMRSISPPTATTQRSGTASQRQTPSHSLSSSPPTGSPSAFGPSSTSGLIGFSQQQQQPFTPGPTNIFQHRRSISPDNQSVELRSHQDMSEPVPRLPEARRTASLPQLFSRDFLSSSLGSPNEYEGNHNGGYLGPQYATGLGGGLGNGTASNLGSASSGLTASSELPTNSPPSTSPPAIMYPGYRRGSAPPVVLSVVTNSLADLDSLADELVSEPATSASASQLFNMPTVFPGSLKGTSISEYL